MSQQRHVASWGGIIDQLEKQPLQTYAFRRFLILRHVMHQCELFESCLAANLKYVLMLDLVRGSPVIKGCAEKQNKSL